MALYNLFSEKSEKPVPLCVQPALNDEARKTLTEAGFVKIVEIQELKK